MSYPYDPGSPFRRKSQYGMRRDPLTGKEQFPGKEQFHSGQDFAAPEGTPISAASAGRVVYSGFNANLGNTIIVQSPAGYSLYAHMKDGSARLKMGQSIWPGDIIGEVGNTGARTTGPHLHYSVLPWTANISHSNVGGAIGVALNKRNTRDPASFDPAPVPYLDMPQYDGRPTSMAAPVQQPTQNAGEPTFEARWRQSNPVARFPLEALLSPDNRSALEKWSSAAPGQTASSSSQDEQATAPGQILDRVRRERPQTAAGRSVFETGVAPAVPFVPQNSPMSPDRPTSFDDRFGDWFSQSWK